MNDEESRWFPVKFSGFSPREFWGSHQEGWNSWKPWRWGSPGSVQGLPDRRNQSTDMRIRGSHQNSELGRGLTVGWREKVSPSLDSQSFHPHVVQGKSWGELEDP